MKPLAHFDKNAHRLCISLDAYDARILMYALNTFTREFSSDTKTRTHNWAKRVEHFSGDICNASQRKRGHIMMRNKKVFNLGNYTLTVFDDPSLDKHCDASDAPDVLIDLEMERDDGEAEFLVKCHGELSEKRVVELIAALNEALERARKAAKKRGYYEFVAAAEKEGVDESGWPPSWSEEMENEEEGS